MVNTQLSKRPATVLHLRTGAPSPSDISPYRCGLFLLWDFWLCGLNSRTERRTLIPWYNPPAPRIQEQFPDPYVTCGSSRKQSKRSAPARVHHGLPWTVYPQQRPLTILPLGAACLPHLQGCIPLCLGREQSLPTFFSLSSSHITSSRSSLCSPVSRSNLHAMLSLEGLYYHFSRNSIYLPLC